MSLPLDPNKWQRESHITAKTYIEYARSKGLNTQLNVKKALLSWAKSYSLDLLNKNNINSDYILNHKFFKLPRAMVYPYMSFGAPAAVILMEELSELGVSEFIGLGIAGSLDEGLKPGDIVVCQQAYRDEGTSYNYLDPQQKTVFASSSLLTQVESIFTQENIKYHLGSSWTTDAPYRETREEIVNYRRQGLATVDMEASAIYACAQVKKLEALTVFVISDVFNSEKWKPHFHNKIVKQQFQKIFTS